MQPCTSCWISFRVEAADWLVSGDRRPAVRFPVKHVIYLFAGCHLLTVIRRSSETEVSHSFCCLAWRLNACKWSVHTQIANTTANKMQMQRAMQLIRLVGTDPHGRDKWLCAFKHFLLNQKCVAVFNFLFNMKEALRSIYMSAFKSYDARY